MLITNSVSTRKRFQERHYRAWARARMGLPFCVRGAGRILIADGDLLRISSSGFAHLFWFESGDGTFACPGKRGHFRAEQILFFESRTPHTLEGGAEGCGWRFWTLDGPEADIIIRAYGLKHGTPCEAGRPPAKDFKRLESLLSQTSIQAEREATVAALSLLCAASGALTEGIPDGKKDCDGLAAECARRLEENLADPTLTIDKVAEELGAHRGALYRRFHRRYGVSPKQHLLQLRLTKAMEMKDREPSPTYGEIAKACGFSSAKYLRQVMSQAMGHRDKKS